MSAASSMTERIPTRLIVVCGALTMFGPLCVDMYLPAFPRIADELNTSASAVQASLTSCMVGMGFGQLLVGPLSDRFGRRPPMIACIVAFVVSSFAIAIAPNVQTMIALRVVQGLGGAAGMVISRAMVRDLYSGVAAAKFFSVLMMIGAVGPLLAPQIGAAMAGLGSWRWMFVMLGVVGLLLLAMTWWLMPETHAAEHRGSGGVRDSLRSMRHVLSNRRYLATALSGAIAYGVMFAYLAGSPFVYQEMFGLSAQEFGLVFAVNILGLVGMSQLNSRLVGRFPPLLLMRVGVGVYAVTGLAVLLIGLVHPMLVPTLICTFVIVCSYGLISPNSSAMALEQFPHTGGTASSLMGMAQFVVAGITAPLVGLGGTDTMVPMGIVMVVCGLLSVAMQVWLGRLVRADSHVFA